LNATDQRSPQADVKATIVLVHGAFADASSWSGVMEWLPQQGHSVVAPADPLRGVAADSAYTASLLNQIDVVRSMARRARAEIVGVEGSHAIMISPPQAVTDHILTAARAVADAQ